MNDSVKFIVTVAAVLVAILMAIALATGRR